MGVLGEEEKKEKILELYFGVGEKNKREGK